MAAKATKKATQSSSLDTVILAGMLLLSIVPLLFYSRGVTRAFDLTKSAVLAWMWLLLGSWILLLSLRQGLKWLKTPLLLPVAGYALSLTLSTIFSITPTISFLGVYERQLGLMTQLTVMSLAFLYAGVLNRRDKFNIAVDTIIMVGTLNALVGILQFLGFDPLGFRFSYGTEAFGFMGNPDFFGPVMVITTFMAFGRLLTEAHTDNAWIWGPVFLVQFFSLTLTAQGGMMGLFGGLIVAVLCYFTFANHDDRKKSLGTLWKIGLVALLLFALSLFINQANRTANLVSAVLGSGAGFVLYVLLNTFFLDKRSHPKLWRASLALTVVVAVFLGIGIYVVDTVDPVTIAKYIANTAATRLVLWKHTVFYSLENTLHGRLFGIGIESFRRGFMQYKPLELSQLEPNVNYDDPHNNFLGILAKVGVVGFVFYLWMFVAGAKVMYRLLQSQDADRQKLLYLGLLAALLAYATNLVTIFDMLPSLIMFYVLLGLIMAAHNLHSTDQTEPKPLVKWTVWVAYALLLALGLYNGYYYLNAWKADSQFRYGLGNLQYYDANKDSISDQEQKLRILTSALYYMDQAMKYNPNESYYEINYIKGAQSYWDLTSTSSPNEAKSVAATAIAKAANYEQSTWAPENLNASLGNLYVKMGALNEGIDAYRKAVNWDKHFFSARMNLALLLRYRAQTYLSQKNTMLAKQDYEEAIGHIKHAQLVLKLTNSEDLIALRNQMALIQKTLEEELAGLEKGQ
ncbi:O-antigen ligase family protein [Coprothermobacteraceae bacterium]|nr:O-antigen ligase family protein [Coprothermobacteraceae bacterium]